MVYLKNWSHPISVVLLFLHFHLNVNYFNTFIRLTVFISNFFLNKKKTETLVFGVVEDVVVVVGQFDDFAGRVGGRPRPRRSQRIETVTESSLIQFQRGFDCFLFFIFIFPVTERRRRLSSGGRRRKPPATLAPSSGRWRRRVARRRRIWRRYGVTFLFLFLLFFICFLSNPAKPIKTR